MPKKTQPFQIDLESLKYEFGTVSHYARRRGLKYGVLRVVIYSGGRSKVCEDQLNQDGFLTYVRKTAKAN